MQQWHPRCHDYVIRPVRLEFEAIKVQYLKASYFACGGTHWAVWEKYCSVLLV